MHPNLFLKTFWQMDLRPQVFVAMSFSDVYRRRLDEVIAPAIAAVKVDGVRLQPYRVDLSKSGDSILTDIMDGIAHSQMFLADVSIIGHDSKTGCGYRNGNVMYEVGLALACRQTAEVLLIRDDQEKFLFDVSTVPHVHIDFTDTTKAKHELAEHIVGRLRERDLLSDARVRKTLASLTTPEIDIIEAFVQHAPPSTWGFTNEPLSINALAAIPRLCDKQMIALAHKWEDGGAAYKWTQFGFAVAEMVTRHLQALPGTTTKPEPSTDTTTDSNAGPSPTPPPP